MNEKKMDELGMKLDADAVGYQDLFDVIGHDVPQFDYSVGYLDWEQKIATPALEGLGYTVHGWGTGERDSWGPLSRTANVTSPNGEEVKLVYG